MEREQIRFSQPMERLLGEHLAGARLAEILRFIQIAKAELVNWSVSQVEVEDRRGGEEPRPGA